MNASNGRRPIPLLWLGLFLAIVALVVGAALLSRRVALAAPAQPIAFPHRLHANAGVPCLFCHPNALRSPIAGLPSVQRCMGCHAYVERENPEVKKIAAYWEEGQPIPWARVLVEPDFVYFSHQPHLSAGLSCETCHGDVASMGTYRPVVRMDMGWCLNCHLEQPQEDAARLTDCLTCHQ